MLTKEKRLLRKNNISRKNKILITMSLIIALLLTVFNLITMFWNLANHGEIPDLELCAEIIVAIIWLAFGAVFFCYKKSQSELFRELEGIYNTSFDSMGKILLMQSTIKKYHYKEKMSKIERDVYGIALEGGSEQEKKLALRAEIESGNIFETIFSLIGIFLTVVLDKTKIYGEGGIMLWLSALIVLFLLMWMICFIEDMKRNRFILTVIEGINVNEESIELKSQKFGI